MSGIVRDNHSNLSTPFIDEERVRDAQRPTVLLRDQPDRVRPCFHVTIDRIVVKVIDSVKEAATTIVSARPLQDAAIVVSIAWDDRAYADRAVDCVSLMSRVSCQTNVLAYALGSDSIWVLKSASRRSTWQAAACNRSMNERQRTFKLERS